MTDEQIEGLVARILQRLRPPVLVMVTAADGYRTAIRQAAATRCASRWRRASPTPPRGGRWARLSRHRPGRMPCRQRRGGRYCYRFSITRWLQTC